MMTDVVALVASAGLTWVMLFVASQLRTRSWTPEGMRLGVGNRETLPEPSPLAGRADRAAKNMLENMVLFVAVVAAARFAGASAESTALGATIFFWARVAYAAVYWAGIPYLRTVIWAVALAGIGLIAAAAITAG